MPLARLAAIYIQAHLAPGRVVENIRIKDGTDLENALQQPWGGPGHQHLVDGVNGVVGHGLDCPKARLLFDLFHCHRVHRAGLGQINVDLPAFGQNLFTAVKGDVGVPDLAGVCGDVDAPGLRYGVFSFPFVKLYLAGDDRSLAMAAFAGTPDAKALTRVLKRGTALSVDAALAFLRAYMNGAVAPLPAMDMGPYTEKEKAIYRELVKVEFGGTLSYGELAAKAGLPRAARFAGNAMAKNLFPVFVPCHRVIRGDGRPGRYTGGEGIKLNLLAHEGVTFVP